MVDTLPNSSKQLLGLGIYSHHADTLLYVTSQTPRGTTLERITIKDGIEISQDRVSPILKDSQRRPLPIERCSDFRISHIAEGYALTFKYDVKNQSELYVALSQDLLSFKRISKISIITESGMIIPDYSLEGEHIVLYGENYIKLARSNDLKFWVKEDEPILQPRTDHIGPMPLSIGTVMLTREGIVLIYYARGISDSGRRYSLHAALLDKKNPRKLLWQSDAIWEQSDEWGKGTVKPLGVSFINGRLISYWDHEKEGIFAIPHTALKHVFDKQPNIQGHVLQRFKGNPIIKPIVEHFWESKATFNPGALYMHGKVHLVYRAIGEHDTSVIGYAVSGDGVNIDERLDEPIYVPTEPFECPSESPYSATRAYVSGGGYGGCEDPRLTKVDDKIYMTYVAYNGRTHPRLAMTSISENDFMNRKWNWSRPVLISKEGIVNKNACLFPEKFDGKYVMMHRVFPNILIDYLDDLDFDGKTKWLRGDHKIRPRRTAWDSRKVGAGAPPMKTPYGWLLIYHAVGDQDPGRYKMGAMLLDLKDPTKVIARSRRPILAPDYHYENEGFKAGVAYPCGAVIKDNQLIVYYGGADTVVCAAVANVHTFIHTLIDSGTATLEPIKTPQHPAVYAQSY